MSYLDDIKKKLEGHEKINDVLSLIDKHAEQVLKPKIEKAEKEASKKANNEAKNVRDRYKQKWKDLNLDPDHDEFDDNLEKLREKIEKAGESEAGENARVTALEKRLDKAEKKAEKAETEKNEFKSKVRQKEIEGTILSALSEKKAIKPKILLPNILSSVDSGDDLNDPVYKHGDEELTLTDGVAKFLDENPEFVANSGSPGGESGGDKGGTGAPNKNAKEIEARRGELRSKFANAV